MKKSISLPAHEIFLRDALTTGHLGITPPFLKHNLLKLEEVERVEDKLRRRDLVVDEETNLPVLC